MKEKRMNIPNHDKSSVLYVIIDVSSALSFFFSFFNYLIIQIVRGDVLVVIALPDIKKGLESFLGREPWTQNFETRSLFGSRTHEFQTSKQEAISSKLQPINIARHLSRPSHYLKKILERQQLEYQSLERKGLMSPVKGTISGQKR